MIEFPSAATERTSRRRRTQRDREDLDGTTSKTDEAKRERHARCASNGERGEVLRPASATRNFGRREKSRKRHYLVRRPARTPRFSRAIAEDEPKDILVRRPAHTLRIPQGQTAPRTSRGRTAHASDITIADCWVNSGVAGDETHRQRKKERRRLITTAGRRRQGAQRSQIIAVSVAQGAGSPQQRREAINASSQPLR